MRMGSLLAIVGPVALIGALVGCCGECDAPRGTPADPGAKDGGASIWSEAAAGFQGQLWQSPEMGFSIEFPAGWSVMKGLSSSGGKVKAMHTDAQGRTAYLTMTVVPEGRDPAELEGRTAEDLFREMFAAQGEGGPRLVDSGEVEVGGLRMLWFEAQPAVPANVEPLPPFLNGTLVSGGMSFSLLGNVQGGSPWYEEVVDTFRGSIGTFRRLE